MTYLIPLEPLLFEPGDRMSREEFLRRWEQMPNVKFAELIDGVVYMPSPLSFDHGEMDVILHAWGAVYASRTTFVQAAANSTWMLEESAPQPDFAIRIKPGFGGKSRNSGNYAEGPPELAAEVTRSSRSYDLGPKLKLYERTGVQEYLVALLEERRTEWRVLRSGHYELMRPVDGVYRSEVFPGLWLDEAAFWNADSAAVLARLEEGLQSTEFRQFRDLRAAK